MKKLVLAAVFGAGIVSAVEAAPTDAVTQADIQALVQRLNKLEAENKAQAQRIAELEGKQTTTAAKVAQVEKNAGMGPLVPGEGTETNETGRIWTLANGQKYYLADQTARIFQPLTESGLQFQPYGYLVLEGVYNTRGTDYPMYTDYVRPDKGTRNDNGAYHDHTSTLSVNDSILGFNLLSPETYQGWKFNGKFEFDLAGDDANHTDFHVRHLFWNMEHETGWSVLFGQTWHLWKMVAPSEIDGAWMENTGYPYRRSPQVRVTKKWEWDDSSLEARVGLVKNGPGMGGDRDENGTQDNEQSAWCLFEGALVYDHNAAWDENRRWLVGVGGQYGRDSSRRATDNGDGTYSCNGTKDEYDSDMVMLAASVPFLEKFTLCGQVFAGENLGGVQAGIGQQIAYSSLYEKGHEVSTVGGFIDLRYDITDKWALALGYGFDDPTVTSSRSAAFATRGAEGATYNDRTYFDIFYQFNANLHFGLEYAYLTTDYLSEVGDDADDHRIQGTVYYDF